jgi:enterochelin esterase-like enzyme
MFWERNKLQVMLRKQNLQLEEFSAAYQESALGHNWTAWRDRLADAFVAWWK